MVLDSAPLREKGVDGKENDTDGWWEVKRGGHLCGGPSERVLRAFAPQVKDPKRKPLAC